MPAKRPAPVNFATRDDIERLEERLDDRIEKLSDKIDALRDRFDDRLSALEPKIEQKIGETKSTNDLVFKLILQQLTDIRTIADQRQTIADQRHEAIMAQFEKLLSRSAEN
jgi:hypothetical protein